MRVVVLMGGISTERDISIRSGQAIYKGLVSNGFEAKLFDIGYDNVQELINYKPDLAYIALHGVGGEDGSIQGLLQWLQIPYTGPGLACSAICMDKILTKKIFHSTDVATPKYSVINFEKEINVDKIIDELGFPLVVKAASQGSSIGLKIVDNKDDLVPAIKHALSFNGGVLLEQYISGMELTVPIIGNEEPEVLPIIQIKSANEFYDFESKYTPGMSQHIIPAQIDDETRKLVENEAKKAYLAAGCRGISRVDVILDNNFIPYVIEINTVPGMTETSLFPDSAKYAGISFPELVKKVVDYALKNNRGL